MLEHQEFTDRSHDGEGEEESLWEGPRVGPIVSGIVAVFLMVLGPYSQNFILFAT